MQELRQNAMHLSLRAPSLSLRLGFRGCRFRAQGLELWALRLQDARLGLRVFIGYMAPLEAQQFLWPRSLCYASVPKTTAGGFWNCDRAACRRASLHQRTQTSPRQCRSTLRVSIKINRDFSDSRHFCWDEDLRVCALNFDIKVDMC